MRLDDVGHATNWREISEENRNQTGTISDGHGHVDVGTAGAPVRAAPDLATHRALLLGGLAPERLGPLEPGEVGLEVLRGHAPERLHEVLEPGVQAVDPVDAVLRRVGLLQLGTEPLEHGGV